MRMWCSAAWNRILFGDKRLLSCDVALSKAAEGYVTEKLVLTVTDEGKRCVQKMHISKKVCEKMAAYCHFVDPTEDESVSENLAEAHEDSGLVEFWQEFFVKEKFVLFGALKDLVEASERLYRGGNTSEALRRVREFWRRRAAEQSEDPGSWAVIATASLSHLCDNIEHLDMWPSIHPSVSLLFMAPQCTALLVAALAHVEEMSYEAKLDIALPWTLREVKFAMACHGMKNVSGSAVRSMVPLLDHWEWRRVPKDKVRRRLCDGVASYALLMWKSLVLKSVVPTVEDKDIMME